MEGVEEELKGWGRVKGEIKQDRESTGNGTGAFQKTQSHVILK